MRQTEREYLQEHIKKIAKKLADENSKSKPNPELANGYRLDIEKSQALLDEDGPDLDKPHGLDWNAIG